MYTLDEWLLILVHLVQVSGAEIQDNRFNRSVGLYLHDGVPVIQ
jgi:hypothetical protein